MGFFDGFKVNTTGKAALRAHIAANQASDKGNLADATQKYKDAMMLYDEAWRMGVTKVSVLQGYAILLMREGNYEKAREVMLKIEKQPGLTSDDWYHLRLNYSVYQWHEGQLDKAIETARRSCGEHLTSSVYTTLGMYLVDKARQTGEFKEALDFNKEAVEYDEEDAGALDNLGQLYEVMAQAAAEAGEPELAAKYHGKAKKNLEKAHANRPRQITTLYYLAKIYQADGQPEEAKKMFKDLDNLYFSKMCPVSKDMMFALADEIGR